MPQVLPDTARSRRLNELPGGAVVESRRLCYSWLLVAHLPALPSPHRARAGSASFWFDHRATVPAFHQPDGYRRGSHRESLDRTDNRAAYVASARYITYHRAWTWWHYPCRYRYGAHVRTLPCWG